MSNEVEAIESDFEEEQHELIGKSIFYRIRANRTTLLIRTPS